MVVEVVASIVEKMVTFHGNAQKEAEVSVPL